MRTFSEGRLARAIAYLLSGVFLWSLGFMGLAAPPASAQIVTKGASTQSVGVVPFQNRTKLRPETLGDEAAAAVSVELRDRLLLDVLPKADVSLQMRDLGMTPPLSDVEMVRLAADLEVALVVAGEVRGARIISTRQGRHAEIVLAVRLFDRMARENVNGAVVSAVSPTSDAGEDVLVEKALQQAAFTAVQQMKSRPTVTAMVLWSRADTVFLNVGTRGGMRPGMRLVAVRGGERIGLAKVTEADAIGAYATSVEGSPLRTGDHLRAVYELPSGLAPERVGVAQEKRNRFETVAIAFAAFLGLGNFASRVRRVNEGNTVAPGFQAANLANGADFGLSGYLTSFNPARDLQPRPAAIVHWERYQGTESPRIIAFIITRSGGIVGVVVPPTQDVTEIIDTGTNAPGFQTIEVTIDTVSGGLLTVVPEFTPWGPKAFDPVTGIFSSPTWAEFVTDNAADNRTEITNDSLFVGWFPSIQPGDDIGGMAAGMGYQYTITPFIVEQDRNGVWSLGNRTEPSTAENFVVGVAPAGTFSTYNKFNGLSQGVYRQYVTLDNPEVLLNLATFRFYYPVGAYQIQLQLARSPNFEFDPGLGVLNVSLPPAAPAPSGFPFVNSYYVTQPAIDLSAVPGSGDVFIWRVRARDFFDSHEPRSYPLIEPIESDPLRGWVYSTSNAFVPTAPASRAAMMHEQRAAMEALRAARVRLPRTATTNRLHRAQ